jgi:hypothetical protein
MTGAERDADQLRTENDELREELQAIKGDATEAIFFANRERDAARVEVDRLQARIDDYENRITWDTTCGNCARLLDASIRDYERAEQATVEVDTLRAKIERVIAAARGWKTCGEHTGIASNRCMLPSNHRDRHDCQIVPGDATYLDELLAGAVPGSPPEPARVTVRYEPCVTDDSGRCTRWSHDHDDAVVPGSPETRPRRYDQCDKTCTVDCGHCKGKGRPAVGGSPETPATTEETQR